MRKRRVDPYEAHLGMMGLGDPEDPEYADTKVSMQTQPESGSGGGFIVVPQLPESQRIPLTATAADAALRRERAAVAAARKQEMDRAQAVNISIAVGQQRAQAAMALAKQREAEQIARNIRAVDVINQRQQDAMALARQREAEQIARNIRAAEVINQRVATAGPSLPAAVTAPSFAITAPPGSYTPVPTVAVVVGLPASTAEQNVVDTSIPREEVVSQFVQAFKMPLEPFFDLGLHASRLAAWKRDYEYFYQEKAPETDSEMVSAISRSNELNNRKSNQLTVEKRWEEKYNIRYPRNADEMARAKSLLEARQWQIENDAAVAARERQMRLAQQKAAADREKEEQIRAALISQQEYETGLKAAQAAERERLSKPIESVFGPINRVQSIASDWDRANESYATGALQQGVMKTQNPEKYEQLLGETIRDINKRNYINANLQLKSTDYEMAATSSAGIYDAEKHKEIISREAQRLADLFDKQHPKSTLEERVLRSPKDSGYRFAAATMPKGALEWAEEKITATTLKQVAPAYIYDVTKYKSSDGRYTASSATRLLEEWITAMSGPAKKAFSKLSRREIAELVMRSVGSAMKSNVPSILRAYTLAADSTRESELYDSGSKNIIDQAESQRRMEELARTLNAATTETATLLTPEATLGAGVKKLVAEVVSEMNGGADIGWMAQWTGGSPKNVETKFSGKETPQGEIAARAKADYDRQIAEMNANAIRIQNEQWAKSQWRILEAGGSTEATDKPLSWPMQGMDGYDLKIDPETKKILLAMLTMTALYAVFKAR
jgi:hypothetical protein